MKFADLSIRQCIADCLDLDETAEPQCFYNATSGKGASGENHNFQISCDSNNVLQCGVVVKLPGQTAARKL
jgi:hypothetical protein